MDPTCSLDFETYSEAGYVYDAERDRWTGAGIRDCGSDVYARHPSARVLCAAYDYGEGVRLWHPDLPVPADLLEWVRWGGIISAWNSAFEFQIWNHVCTRLYGWPALPIEQTQDTAAAARAYGLPGTLANAAVALGSAEQKDARGAALVKRWCVPRPRNQTRAMVEETRDDLYLYCEQDVRTEREIAATIPPLSPWERRVWLADQRINERGVAVDLEAVEDLDAIVAGVSRDLTAELQRVTGGAVQSSGQVAATIRWLAGRGVYLDDLTEQSVSWQLDNPAAAVQQDPDALMVLQIRRHLGSASVRKLEAIQDRATADERLRGLLVFCGAERTGRWTGRGPQPQNLPRGELAVSRCTGECGEYQRADGPHCECGGSTEPAKWGASSARDVLVSARARDDRAFARRWGDPLAAVAGALRGLFVAAPGHRLIASDYSAIEAVVLAAIAGEQWRLDVFRGHGMIYEASASKITGIPLDEYIRYRAETGSHHPTRNAIGKLAELASGYGGGLGAWDRFGAREHMDEEQIRDAIRRWRQESPAIVDLWYGLERAAIAAIQSPRGVTCPYRGITYYCDARALHCVLPSGRALSYHRPSIQRGATPWGEMRDQIHFEGWNSNAEYGKPGWQTLRTYGGRLAENVVQAVARDILADALVRVEAAGYRTVLHVHDEIVCEMPDGAGGVAELEQIMSMMPAWAAGWPVVARGGWEGREYRKG